MKKAAWLLGILMMGVIVLGCSNKAGSAIDQGLALKFLQGIQDGDKDKMYEAANLTTAFVNDSRDKLVHSKQNNLTEQQRKEFEHALRISGQIDFFIAKIRP